MQGEKQRKPEPACLPAHGPSLLRDTALLLLTSLSESGGQKREKRLRESIWTGVQLMSFAFLSARISNRMRGTGQLDTEIRES